MGQSHCAIWESFVMYAPKGCVLHNCPYRSIAYAYSKTQINYPNINVDGESFINERVLLVVLLPNRNINKQPLPKHPH